MPEIWINQDPETREYYALDEVFSTTHTKWAAGPIEVSNELFERIQEHDREHALIQDILESLEYEWEYPDDEEIVRDCD